MYADLALPDDETDYTRENEVDDEKNHEKEVDEKLDDEIARLEKLLSDRQKKSSEQRKELNKKREIVKENKRIISDDARMTIQDEKDLDSREENAGVVVDNSLENLVDILKRSMSLHKQNNQASDEDEYYSNNVDKKEVDSTNKEINKEIALLETNEKKEVESKDLMSCNGNKKECNTKKSIDENNAKKEKKEVETKNEIENETTEKKEVDVKTKKDTGREGEKLIDEEVATKDKKDTGREGEKIQLKETSEEKKESKNEKKETTKDESEESNKKKKEVVEEITETKKSEDSSKENKEIKKKKSTDKKTSAFMKKKKKEITLAKNTLTEDLATKKENTELHNFDKFEETKRKAENLQILRSVLNEIHERKREKVRREKLHAALEDLLTLIHEKRSASSFTNENEEQDDEY